ncbi:MAG: RNA polymerase sigma-70 factor [Gracilimonas sp.]
MNLAIIQLLLLIAAAFDEQSNQQDIYAKIKNGDQKAFKSFFDTHHQTLFHYLVNKGVSRESAEDLIQKAFIYIWENRAKIDEHKSLRSYLFRIAHTRMLNLFRDHGKFDENTSFSELHSQQAEPDAEIESQELNHIIEQAISAMPEKRQKVFRLCFLQEFTYKEAAGFMEVSVKTIENHMALALKDLRAALSETAKDFL